MSTTTVQTISEFRRKTAVRTTVICLIVSAVISFIVAPTVISNLGPPTLMIPFIGSGIGKLVTAYRCWQRRRTAFFGAVAISVLTSSLDIVVASQNIAAMIFFVTSDACNHLRPASYYKVLLIVPESNISVSGQQPVQSRLQGQQRYSPESSEAQYFLPEAPWHITLLVLESKFRAT